MRYFLLFILCVLAAGCSTKENYTVTSYYPGSEKDSITASIINYIFIAPPYVSMKDRFKPEHRSFYVEQSAKFELEKYFVAPNGTHFLYITRQAARIGEKRGVGGHFKLKDHYQLSDFREVYVTPELPEADVKNRCAFLFDEMVKGNIEQYLKMKDYVQWPNELSFYDTVSYEWHLKPEVVK